MEPLKITWPLSKDLLLAILDDQVSDRFVTELVWERLGYKQIVGEEIFWKAGSNTPQSWLKDFSDPPEIISHRRASVKLTRSIPKNFKQGLKKYLGFGGYKISELFPRRTRRATAVNWLIAWTLCRGEQLPKSGPLPDLLEIPEEPLRGHPGDPEIN